MRDFDLHNVVGAITLPFLLMWGVTGAAFELPVVEKVWLTITGGQAPKDEPFTITANHVTHDTPRIGLDRAVQAARDAVPHTQRVTWVSVPTKDANFYEIDLVSSWASYAHRAVYSGDTYVLVDPHDATHLKVIEAARGPASNRLYDKVLEPSHFGWNVNGWWRAIWFLMGLGPLALMITGVSTWLFKRAVKERRRRTGLALRRAAIPHGKLAEQCDPDPARDRANRR